MIRVFCNLSLVVLFVAALSACDKEVTDYGPIDKAVILDYLAKNHLQADSTDSGLYYIIHKPGSTNHPSKSSYISINYKGYYTDSTVFETSYSHGTPASFKLSSMIKGWQQGIPLIGVGGKITLFLPSALGYGSEPYGSVPANSVLIFDVELVDFY